MERKIRLSLSVPALRMQIERGLKRLGVEIEKVDEEKVDAQTIFVGEVTNIADRKRFNISGYSIALGPAGKNSPWADENIEDCFSLEDYEYFIPSLIVARQFGDMDETVLSDIRKYLAEKYSMNGEWTAHVDRGIWTDEKTPFLAVQQAIARLVDSSTEK